MENSTRAEGAEVGAVCLAASRLIADKQSVNTISQVVTDALPMGSGLLVSVDDLRFSIRFRNDAAGAEMLGLADTVQCDGVPITHQSNKPNGWRYLYAFPMGSSTVRLGIGWVQSDGKTLMGKGFLEFNPNKVGHCKEIALLMSKVRRFSKSIDLDRYDIAIDIPLDRANCRLRKDNRGYEFIDKGHGVTEYLGTRSKPGRVKLYDKTKEAELSETWTRLELTCDAGWDASKVVSMMPTVYAWDDSGCDEQTRAWVRAFGLMSAEVLSSGKPIEPYISMLSYDARRKVREYLESPCVVIDSAVIDGAISRAKDWEREFKIGS